jgi:hypothetical protein
MGGFMVTDLEFVTGMKLRFRYHTSGETYRELQVHRVRRLESQPLQEVTLAMRPEVRRGSVLITGIDLGKQAFRAFYLEHMEALEVVAVPAFTLALYDPANLDEPPEVIDGDLMPSTLQGMVKMIAEYNQMAIEEPALFKVLGLFHATDPQLRTNIFDGEPNVEL